MLSDLFPAELCEQFERVKGQTGIHNIYKFALDSEPGCCECVGERQRKRPCERQRQAAVRHTPGSRSSTSPSRRWFRRTGDEIGRLIIFDDITDRSELEQRLVQADKLSSIGLLAAGVAHEVNTPLAVISTYAQMLAKQVVGGRDEVEAAGQDRQADVPRQRDRQLAAELLAHLAARLRRRRPEPSSKKPSVWSSTSSTNAHVRRRTRAAARAAAREGQRRQTAAGVPESCPECARRDGRRRHARHPHRGATAPSCKSRSPTPARHPPSTSSASTIRSSRPRSRAKAPVSGFPSPMASCRSMAAPSK